jgi:hypothetical protein
MTEKTWKMKEILCWKLRNGMRIYMSADKEASRFLDEVDRFFRHSLFEKLLDVPEKMCAVRRGGFREILYGIPVCGIEIGDEGTVVKFPEVRFDNRRRPMPVDVEKRDLIVREYPEPVALPSGLVHMDVRRFCTFSKKNLKINRKVEL